MTGLVPADAVAIGFGAFLGALSRYQVGRLAAEWVASDPNRLGKWTGWHTAGINMGGSFLLGGITASPVVNNPAGMATKSAAPGTHSSRRLLPPSIQGMSPRAKLMMGVGFCGSYTTFSTYSVDVVTWMQQGKMSKAASYVAANNVGGFVAAAAGMVIAKKLFGC